MPSLSVYNIRIYWKVEGYENKNKPHVDTQIQVRENGGSLNFNFISLLNSMVDENWVCQHRLLQFIFGKWCHVRSSDLCRLFVNGKFPKRFHCVCTNRPVYYFVFSLYSPWATVRLLHYFEFFFYKTYTYFSVWPSKKIRAVLPNSAMQCVHCCWFWLE